MLLIVGTFRLPPGNVAAFIFCQHGVERRIMIRKRCRRKSAGAEEVVMGRQQVAQCSLAIAECHKVLAPRYDTAFCIKARL